MTFEKLGQRKLKEPTVKKITEQHDKYLEAKILPCSKTSFHYDHF